MLYAEDFHPHVNTVRKKIQEELIRQFERDEREGHLEDLLVATILDPR